MGHFDIFLDTVFALCVVLALAHTCGALIQFVGQPKVVGEVLAGIILGPSLIGALAPDWLAATFNPEVKHGVFLLSQIGLAAYMFLVGCDLDLKIFTVKSMRNAAALSLTGILPSIILGGACGFIFYDMMATGERAVGVYVFSFYLGSALSITAFPLIARILDENCLTGSPMGVLAMLAASIDDAIAWCLLALILAIADAQPLSSGLTPVLGGLVFFAVCFLVLRPLLARLARNVDARGELLQEEFALVLVLLLATIWVTDRIGIYSVFGGFLLGVSMPRSLVLLRELRSHMYQFVVVFFLPLFFANSGLNTDIASVVSANLLLPFVVILICAFLTKYVFCAIAMRAIGFSWRESSAIGGLFNARGLMLLIFANIGIVRGLINTSVFTILVIVAVLTTAAAMPIFNRSLGRHEVRG